MWLIILMPIKKSNYWIKNSVWKKYNLETIYAVFEDNIEVETPIGNQKLSSKYAHSWGWNSIIVISKWLVNLSSDFSFTRWTPLAYHGITKERMENKGSIIFQLEKEKSLKILLSEFPSSYKRLSLIALRIKESLCNFKRNWISRMFWFSLIPIHIFFWIFE